MALGAAWGARPAPRCPVWAGGCAPQRRASPGGNLPLSPQTPLRLLGSPGARPAACLLLGTSFPGVTLATAGLLERGVGRETRRPLSWAGSFRLLWACVHIVADGNKRLFQHQTVSWAAVLPPPGALPLWSLSPQEGTWASSALPLAPWSPAGPHPTTGVPSLGRAAGPSRTSPTSLKWALGPLPSLPPGGSRWGGNLVPRPVRPPHPACSLSWVSWLAPTLSGWRPWSPGGTRLE